MYFDHRCIVDITNNDFVPVNKRKQSPDPQINQSDRQLVYIGTQCYYTVLRRTLHTKLANLLVNS